MPASVCAPCTLHLQPLTLPRDDRGEKSGLTRAEIGEIVGGARIFGFRIRGKFQPGQVVTNRNSGFSATAEFHTTRYIPYEK